MKKIYVKNGKVVEKIVDMKIIKKKEYNITNFSYNQYPYSVLVVSYSGDEMLTKYLEQIKKNERIIVSCEETAGENYDAYIFYFGNRHYTDWDDLDLYNYYEKICEIEQNSANGAKYIINIISNYNEISYEVDLQDMTKHCITGISKGIAKKCARAGITSNILQISDATDVDSIVKYTELLFNNHYINGEHIKL